MLKLAQLANRMEGRAILLAMNHGQQHLRDRQVWHRRQQRIVLSLHETASRHRSRGRRAGSATHLAHAMLCSTQCSVRRGIARSCSYEQITLAITQSPPKNFDSKSRPTGDLGASLCSSTFRCEHSQPSVLYSRLTFVHSIRETSLGASVISCMRQSSGSRPVSNAIEPAAMLGARLIPALQATRVGILCRISEAIVRIANVIEASLLPSPSLSGNRQ